MRSALSSHALEKPIYLTYSLVEERTMSKFHINPSTGSSGACRAAKGNCPFGGEADHFPTKAAAQAEIEKRLQPLSVSQTASKKRVSDEELASMREELVTHVRALNRLTNERQKQEKLSKAAADFRETVQFSKTLTAEEKTKEQEKASLLVEEATQRIETLTQEEKGLSEKRSDLDRRIQAAQPKPAGTPKAKSHVYGSSTKGGIYSSK